MTTGHDPIMVLGCTSDAGKSFLVTAVCRALANRGISVAPFKAQNMSNNAAVTADGLEIGRAQYTQALAARVVPDVRMNPVLLKPLSETRGAVVLMGRPAPEVEALPWLERPRLTWPVVEAALSSLQNDFDIVVIEGAGSPAEINLRASDIVNMRVALAAKARSYLCVDIDRGGAFAHLLGTWECLEPEERAVICGFVLNRFRGDQALLGNATEWLEARTGRPTVAVVPWIRHALPEEDRAIVRHAGRGATGGRGAVHIGIVVYPYASNLDEFDALGAEEDVSVELIQPPVRPTGLGVAALRLDRFDALILPGSRNTGASVAWLRATGLADELTKAVAGQTPVFGVCGGMQLLGHAIADPHGLEGGDAVGLGLLDVDTTLDREKRTSQVTVRFGPRGASASGYEIHHGSTMARPGSMRAVPALNQNGGPGGWRSGTVLGVYPHGLLDDTGFRQWWLDSIGWAGTCHDWRAAFEAELDRVADAVEATGLVDHMLASTRRV